MINLITSVKLLIFNYLIVFLYISVYYQSNIELYYNLATKKCEIKKIETENEEFYRVRCFEKEIKSETR